jgi:micrococcal nuclease
MIVSGDDGRLAAVETSAVDIPAVDTHARQGPGCATMGRVRNLGWLLMALLLVAGCGGPSSYSSPTPRASTAGAPSGTFQATVERVVDGDTFIARRGGERLRVRLIGVNAPESVKPDSPVECFGHESSAFLRRLLPQGTRVSAAYQGSEHEDRFGRQLWDVWLTDGRFVQAELVRAGVARARAYPPQTQYAGELARLGEAARRGGAGLYRACPGQ